MPAIDLAALIAKLIAWGLKGGWRYIAIGSLVLALGVQHGCLRHAQEKLKTERVTHLRDVAICTDNQAKADAALKLSRGSIQALKDEGARATAAAEKALEKARRGSAVAGKQATAILARPTGPNACAAVSSLRKDYPR